MNDGIVFLVTQSRAGANKTSNLCINPEEQHKIKMLIDKIGPFRHNKRVSVISSTERSAEETAELISIGLKTLDIKKYRILMYKKEDINHDNFSRISTLANIYIKDGDVLIIVANKKFVSAFGKYYAKKEMGININPDPIEPCSALRLDCRLTDVSIIDTQQIIH